MQKFNVANSTVLLPVGSARFITLPLLWILLFRLRIACLCTEIVYFSIVK